MSQPKRLSVDTRVQLLVINHFDELTTQVDIYTEKLLARFDDNDLLVDFVKRKSQNDDKTETSEKDEQIESAQNNVRIDPYSDKYSYESCARFEMPPESTTVKEYLNSSRNKLLDEMKKIKEEIFRSVESEELTVDQDRKDDEEYMEELKSQIFAKRFCFLFDFKETPRKTYSDLEIIYSNECLFDLCLIVTDFYMNSQETNVMIM